MLGTFMAFHPSRIFCRYALSGAPDAAFFFDFEAAKLEKLSASTHSRTVKTRLYIDLPPIRRQIVAQRLGNHKASSATTCVGPDVPVWAGERSSPAFLCRGTRREPRSFAPPGRWDIRRLRSGQALP